MAGRGISAAARAVAALSALGAAHAEVQTPVHLVAELESVRLIQDYGMSGLSSDGINRMSIAGSRDGAEIQGQMYPPGLFLLMRADAPDPWEVGMITDLQASAHLDDGETLRYDPDRVGLRVRPLPDRFGGRLTPSAPIGIQLGVSAHPARMMTSIQASFHAFLVDHRQLHLITLRMDGGQRWRVRGLGVPTGGDDLVLALTSDRKLRCECSTHGLLRLHALTLRDAAGTELTPNAVSQDWGADSLVCELGCANQIAAVTLEVADQVRAGAVTATFVDVPCAGALDRGQCVRAAAWRELPLPAALADPVTVVQAKPAATPAAARP